MKQIIITIDAEGEATVETKGFVGPACKDAAKFIKETLGEQTSEKLKPEFHQRNTNTNNQNA